MMEYIIGYFICLLVCVTGMCLIASQKPSEYQQSIVKVVFAAVIMMLGYWFKVVGTTEGELIIGQKLIFLGGSFVYFFLVMFFSRFIRVEIPDVWRRTMFLVSLVLALFTFSFNRHGLVYREIGFEVVNGVPKLITKDGVFSILYKIQFLILGCAMVQMSVHFMRKTRSKKGSRAVIMLLVPLIPLFNYILEMAFGFSGNILPFSITIAVCLIMYLVYGNKVYDVNDSSKEEAFKRIGAAIIALNANLNFQNCNPTAIKLFPELADMAVNEGFDRPEFETLRSYLNGSKKELFYEGKVYECSVNNLTKLGHLVGQIIWFEDVTAQRELVSFMQNYQAELEKLVDEKTKNIIEIQSHVMLSMSDIIENRDGNTGGHVKRTSTVVGMLIRAMREDGYPGVDDSFMLTVPTTAPMHDIGKIAIPDTILRKEGKLTDEEYAEMKNHASKGAQIVETVLEGVEDKNVVEITANIAAHHHERWDGNGYPDKLKGTDIPLEARIMAIADVYDALVSKRCYKEGMSFDKADAIITDSFGSFFDPSLEKYYRNCLPDIEKFYSEANN